MGLEMYTKSVLPDQSNLPLRSKTSLSFRFTYARGEHAAGKLGGAKSQPHTHLYVCFQSKTQEQNEEKSYQQSKCLPNRKG